MSVLGDFLSILGEIFLFFIQLTADLISIPFGLFGCFAPIWRLPSALMSMSEIKDRCGFRIWCFAQFGLALVDLIAVPMGFISLIAVWRWPGFFSQLAKDFGDERGDRELNYNHKIRGAMAANFGILILDCLAIPAGVLGMLLPWRFLAFWRQIWLVFREKDNDTFCPEYRAVAGYNFLLACADVIAITLGLFSCLVPTRTFAFFTLIYRNWGKGYSDSSNWIKEGCYNFDMRGGFAANFLCAATDLLAIPAGLLSLFMPTRWIPLATLLFREWSSSADPPTAPSIWRDYNYNIHTRVILISNFFFALSDLLIAPFAILSNICIWRWPAFWSAVYTEFTEANPDYYWSAFDYNGRFRVFCLMNFAIAVADIICFPFLAIPLFSIFKTYFVVKSLRSAWGEGKRPEELYFNPELRVVVFEEFALFWVDVMLLPLFLITMVLTPYRVPLVWASLETADTFKKKRIAILEQFGETLLDFPFEIMGLIVIATFWRANILIDKLRAASEANERRGITFQQFAYLFRDIPFFAMFGIIIGTVYRAFSLVLKLRQLCIRDLQDAPILHVHSFKVTFPQKGGAKFDVIATKPANLVVERAKLYVTGEAFWKALAKVQGSGVANVARSMLPVQLVPDYVKAESFPAGQTEIRFTLDFTTNRVKQSTMFKKFAALEREGNPAFIFQIQHLVRGNEAVLMSIPLKPSDFLASEKTGNSVPIYANSDHVPPWKKAGHVNGPAAAAPMVMTAPNDQKAGEVSLENLHTAHDAPPIMMATTTVPALAPVIVVTTPPPVLAPQPIMVVAGPPPMVRQGSANKEPIPMQAALTPQAAVAAALTSPPATAGGMFSTTPPPAGLMASPLPPVPITPAIQTAVTPLQMAPPLTAIMSPVSGVGPVVLSPPAMQPILVQPTPVMTVMAPAAAPIDPEAAKVQIVKGQSLNAQLAILREGMRGRKSSAAYFQDGFWVVVGAMFVQFLIDVLYLFFFILSFIAPWRGLACIICLLEKPARWNVHVQLKLVELLQMTRSLRTDMVLAVVERGTPFLKHRNNLAVKYKRLIKSEVLRERLEAEKYLDVSESMDSEYGELRREFGKNYKFYGDIILGIADSLSSDVGNGPDTVPGMIPAYFQLEQTQFFYEMLLYEAQHSYRTNEIDRDVYNALSSKIRYYVHSGHLKVEKAYSDLQAKDKELKTGLQKCCWFSLMAPFDREWGPTREIVKSMLTGAILDVSALIGFFLILGTVYRFWGLVKGLRKANVHEWRREVILGEIKELFLDAAAFLESLLTIVTLYNAIDMIRDVIIEAIDHGSVVAARRVVRRYTLVLGEDSKKVLNFVFAWDTYKYIIAVAVWGAFVPAACLGAALSGCCGLVSCDKWCLFCLSLILWVFYVIFPPIFVYRLSDSARTADTIASFDKRGLDAINDALIIFLVAIFVLCLLSLIASSRHREFKQIKHPSRTMAINTPNILAIAEILFDTFQLASIALAVFRFNDGDTNPATAGNVEDESAFSDLIRTASYFLFTSPGIYDSVFWFSIAAVCLWFFIISSPVVMEELFEWYDKGTIASSPTWQFFASALSQTLYITIVTNLLKPFQCNFFPDTRFPGNMYGRLNGRADTYCYATEGPQRMMAALSGVLLAFYVITSQILSAESGVLKIQEKEELDVRYPQVYLMTVNAVKVFLTAILLLANDYPWAVLGLVLAGGVFLVLWTALFKPIFGVDACCLKSIVVLRISSGMFVLWTAIIAMIKLSHYQTSVEPGRILWAGYVVLLAVSVLSALYFRYSDSKDIRVLMEQLNVRRWTERLVATELKLHEAGVLLPSWSGKPAEKDKKRQKWKNSIQNADRPFIISARLAEFENAIRLLALEKQFVDERERWLAILKCNSKQPMSKVLMTPDAAMALDATADSKAGGPSNDTKIDIAGGGPKAAAASTAGPVLYPEIFDPSCLSSDQPQSGSSDHKHMEKPKLRWQTSDDSGVTVSKNADLNLTAREESDEVVLKSIVHAISSLLASLTPLKPIPFPGMYQIGNTLSVKYDWQTNDLGIVSRNAKQRLSEAQYNALRLQKKIAARLKESSIVTADHSGVGRVGAWQRAMEAEAKGDKKLPADATTAPAAASTAAPATDGPVVPAVSVFDTSSPMYCCVRCTYLCPMCWPVCPLCGAGRPFTDDEIRAMGLVIPVIPYPAGPPVMMQPATIVMVTAVQQTASTAALPGDRVGMAPGLLEGPPAAMVEGGQFLYYPPDATAFDGKANRNTQHDDEPSISTQSRPVIKANAHFQKKSPLHKPPPYSTTSPKKTFGGGVVDHTKPSGADNYDFGKEAAYTKKGAHSDNKHDTSIEMVSKHKPAEYVPIPTSHPSQPTPLVALSNSPTVDHAAIAAAVVHRAASGGPDSLPPSPSMSRNHSSVSALASGPWTCTACTFLNDKPADKCSMCNTTRPVSAAPVPVLTRPPLEVIKSIEKPGGNASNSSSDSPATANAAGDMPGLVRLVSPPPVKRTPSSEFVTPAVAAAKAAVQEANAAKQKAEEDDWDNFAANYTNPSLPSGTSAATTIATAGPAAATATAAVDLAPPVMARQHSLPSEGTAAISIVSVQIQPTPVPSLIRQLSK